MINRVVRNSKGFSLIEVMFAIFISGVALLTLNIFVTQMNLENKKLADNSITARKNYDFLELMNNPTMWKATVLDVQNYGFFSCSLGLNPHPDLVEPLDCTKIESTFRIVGSDRAILYDQKEKNTKEELVGFTPEGVKCFGFDAVNGNDSCPTHYEISWELPCVKAGNCKEPMAKVTVKQISKYNSKVALNSEKIYSLNVNLPQSVSMAPRDSVYMVNINTPEMEFDVLTTDYDVDTFNLKLKTAVSTAGSTVSITNNKIKYTPMSNFYGVDKIYYTVEQNLFDKVTKSEGVVWIKIMTPYTWVGDGEVEETSVTGKRWYHLYDKRNWCGTVVNNKCNHMNADPRKAVDYLTESEMRTASLVFNENCNTCNVLLKGLFSISGTPKVTVNSIEMGENFPGEIKQIDSLQITIVRNTTNRTATDPSLQYGFLQKGGSFIGANSKANTLTDEVYSQDRDMQIERNVWAGTGKRSITRKGLTTQTFVTFGHFSIEGGKFYAPSAIHFRSGYNSISNAKNFFHQNGSVFIHPQWDGGNFINAQGVEFNDFIFDGAGGFEFNILSSFSVRDLSYYQTGFETQLRGYSASDTGSIYVSRDIYMRGSGGFMVNGWTGWEYAKIVVNGKGDQYIYSNLDLNGNKDRTKIGRLPVLQINKPDGILHFKGDLGINTSFDYQAGTLQFYNDEEVAAGDKQTIEFSSIWNQMWVKNTSGKELVFPNVEFAPMCAYVRIETDFKITGDFIQDKKKYNSQCGGYPFGPQTRKIYVEGDIYAKSGGNEYDYNGLVTLELTGSKDQKIIGSSTTNHINNVSGMVASELLDSDPSITTNVPEAKGYLIHVDINKSGGKVTMEGAIGFMGRFRVINGAVEASNATLSFANSNESSSNTMDITGLTSGPFTIKGLNIQRSMNLMGGKVTITDGLNLPSPRGWYNYGIISNGTLNLEGDLFYNDTFDPTTVDVNRAKIVFTGSKAQTIYAVMAPSINRIGSFDFEVNKNDGTAVKLNCQSYAPSVMLAESITVTSGTLNLNNCNVKVTKTVDVKAGGSIDRGATPGQFTYGTLNNNGTIIPNILAVY